MLGFWNECIFSENDPVCFDCVTIMRLLQAKTWINPSEVSCAIILTKDNHYQFKNDFFVKAAITIGSKER